MRVAIYARVSTESQEARGTIGSQLEVLRQRIAAEGHELVAEYRDDGCSGARLDRPGLDALRDAAEAGRLDAVWCLSPDRLARMYAYQVIAIDELARHGVAVLFHDTPPLADDPQAQLLTQVQGVIAEYERAKIAERYRREMHVHCYHMLGSLGDADDAVQEALLRAWRGIDGFAGPTDLMVIAAAGARAELAAADLLAQAEHGTGSLVVAVSADSGLLGEVAEILAEAKDTGAAGGLVAVGDYEQALALAEAFAPEHLQLIGTEAEQLAGRVTRAGCLFVGAASGSAFGDYIAGSNHVLPTGGAARFASGLSTAHFRRRFSEVRLDRAAAELARIASPVARSESFELHARSMEARIRDNPGG